MKARHWKSQTECPLHRSLTVQHHLEKVVVGDGKDARGRQPSATIKHTDSGLSSRGRSSWGGDFRMAFPSPGGTATVVVCYLVVIRS